jgi:hypothetical protein
MIFQFPNFETLRLSVTSGQVPTSVSLAPARVAFDSDGAISIEPLRGMPPKPMQNALKRLGVKTPKAHLGAAEEIANWLQAAPVARDPHEAQPDPQTPVLFELPANELPSLVSEMLRLGNDRQTFRYLESTAPDEDKRVLLRVIGPPYYTLLRATDQMANSGAVVAYVEKAPRVWVEVGHNHPFAAQIRIPEGRALLLRPPRRWTFLEDGPYEDIYHILDFRLPHSAVNYQERELKGKLTVPLRLVPGNTADVPEMWIITEDGVDILDAFVREADDALIRRLSFAVAENADAPPTVILRTRQQRVKAAPPAITLDKSIGFKTRRGFDNLYLPIGQRLQPTLRKDVLHSLFLRNDDQLGIVWLMPGENGRFKPESIAEEAFRPLEDWVDYVIDHDREALRSWIQATQFDFEHFICPSEQDKPKGGPGGGKTKTKKPAGPDETAAGGDVGTEIPQSGKGKKKVQQDEVDFVGSQELPRPSQDRKDLDELEKTFLEHDGSLDSHERLKLWPQLAVLNTRLDLHDDAAICWMNVLWETADPPIEWIWRWLRGEDPQAQKETTSAEFDAHFAITHPLLPQLRAFIARVIWCTYSASGIALLRQRLPQITRYFETHEHALPFRAVWLGWVHLVRVSGIDVLGLARVRDRLLNRLMPPEASPTRGGLNIERDLPRFLRSAGIADKGRMREVSERASKLYVRAQKWGEEGCDSSGAIVKVAHNRPYFDLMFAFGFARLGDTTQAQELQRSAAGALGTFCDADGKPDMVHKLLLKAFEFRIEQAILGLNHHGTLPNELLTAIDSLAALNLSRYLINRFRDQSWILEPIEKIDPYRGWKAENELSKTLGELHKIYDPKKLAERIDKHVGDVLKGKLTSVEALAIFSEIPLLSMRVGESYAIGMLKHIPSVLRRSLAENSTDIAKKQRKVLEQSLIVAGQYGQSELATEQFDLFIEMLNHRSASKSAGDNREAALKMLLEDVNEVSRECLRTLQKLGLRTQIHHFLDQINALIQKQNLDKLRSQGGTHWYDTLRALLALSEGWMRIGQYEQPKAFLEDARKTLFSKERPATNMQDYTKALRSYISALGHAPVREALDRIEEMFSKMHKLSNTFTTNTHFSRLHLNIVEDVVRTMLSENFTMNETTRRWLEDDEYLVRRRIHGDMRKYLTQSGM